MKIVATLFFPGDPDVLMAPEWEAHVEGFTAETGPSAWGPSEAAAIAALREEYCPCDCPGQLDVACAAAEQCQRSWEDA